MEEKKELEPLDSYETFSIIVNDVEFNVERRLKLPLFTVWKNKGGYHKIFKNRNGEWENTPFEKVFTLEDLLQIGEAIETHYKLLNINFKYL